MVAFDYASQKVLMVDANVQAIDRARQIYNYKGLTQFEGMSSPDMAFDLIGDYDPGMTLLGLGMKEDSLSFLRKIREFPGGRFSAHPVIILIPEGQLDYVREACLIGVEGALKENFDPVMLLKITQATLTSPKRFTNFARFFDDPGQAAPERVKANTQQVLEAARNKRNAIAVKVKAAVESHQLWVRTKAKKGKPCRMANAIFVEVDLTGADLTLAQMPGGNFTKMDCLGANFHKANLKKANFTDANLSQCNFNQAQLCGTNLSRANLTSSTMGEADLENANLFGAKFPDCNMAGANLKGANLVEANLSEAKGISSAQLANCQIDSTTKLPSYV